MEKRNITSIKYRQWIMDAFFDLLKEYSYSEIRITQIVKKADVSRQTFYRHFNTKEDIIDEYCKVACDELTSELMKLEDITIYNFLVCYLNYWQNHIHILELFKTSGCDYFLVTKYNELMFNNLNILRKEMPQYNDEDFDYIKSFIIGGLFNIKLFNLDNKNIKTTEELAKLVGNLFMKL